VSGHPFVSVDLLTRGESAPTVHYLRGMLDPQAFQTREGKMIARSL